MRPIRPGIFCLVSCLTPFLVSCPVLSPVSDAAEEKEIEWVETKGQRFLVYTAGGDTKPRKILEAAEDCFDKLFKELDIRKPVGLWQWEHRTKIHVYPNRIDYGSKNATAPKWSGAVGTFDGRGKIKEIVCYDSGDSLVARIIPHQVAMMVLCELNYGEDAPETKMPFWLQDGIAQLQENLVWGQERAANKALHEGRRNPENFAFWRVQIVPYRHESGTKHIRYTLDPVEPDYKKDPVTGDLKKDQKELKGKRDLANVFYTKSLCFTSFIKNEYGKRNFSTFVKKVQAGEKIEECLKALRGRKTSLKDIQEAWQQYVIDSERRNFAP